MAPALDRKTGDRIYDTAYRTFGDDPSREARPSERFAGAEAPSAYELQARNARLKDDLRSSHETVGSLVDSLIKVGENSVRKEAGVATPDKGKTNGEPDKTAPDTSAMSYREWKEFVANGSREKQPPPQAPGQQREHAQQPEPKYAGKWKPTPAAEMEKVLGDPAHAAKWREDRAGAVAKDLARDERRSVRNEGMRERDRASDRASAEFAGSREQRSPDGKWSGSTSPEMERQLPAAKMMGAAQARFPDSDKRKFSPNDDRSSGEQIARQISGAADKFRWGVMKEATEQQVRDLGRRIARLPESEKQTFRETMQQQGQQQGKDRDR